MTTMANLLSVFGIRDARYQDDVMSLQQVLGPAVADHGNLTVTAALNKPGRRLATVSVTRAVGDIQYDGGR